MDISSGSNPPWPQGEELQRTGGWGAIFNRNFTEDRKGREAKRLLSDQALPFFATLV
jgi:hypothetical protein